MFPIKSSFITAILTTIGSKVGAVEKSMFTKCIGNIASGYECSNVDLEYFLPRSAMIGAEDGELNE